MLSGRGWLQAENTNYSFLTVSCAGQGKRVIELFAIQTKPCSLFPDLTIALSNPIKFFNLQDKRLVKLKDTSGEVSYSRCCSLEHLAWIQPQITEFSLTSDLCFRGLAHRQTSHLLRLTGWQVPLGNPAFLPLTGPQVSFQEFPSI